MSANTPSWFNEPDLKRWHDLSDSMETFLNILSLVGADGAWKLIGEYGGTQIYVPKISTMYRPIRDEFIREEYDQGVSYRDLARKYDLSVPHVRGILA